MSTYNVRWLLQCVLLCIALRVGYCQEGRRIRVTIPLQVTGTDGRTHIDRFDWDSDAGVLPRDAINAFVATTQEEIGKYESTIIDEFNRQYFEQAPIAGRNLLQKHTFTITHEGLHEGPLHESLTFSQGELVHRDPEALLDILALCIKGEFGKDAICVRPLVDLALDLASLGIVKESDLAVWEAQANKLFRQRYANNWREFVRLDGSLPALDAEEMAYNLTYPMYMAEFYATSAMATERLLADRALARGRNKGLNEGKGVGMGVGRGLGYAENEVNTTTVASLIRILMHDDSYDDDEGGDGNGNRHRYTHAHIHTHADDSDGLRGMPRGARLLPTGNTTVSKAYIDTDTCSHYLKNVVIDLSNIKLKVPEEIAETNFGMVNQTEADHFRCTSSLSNHFASRSVRRTFKVQHSPTYTAYRYTDPHVDAAYRREDESVEGEGVEGVDMHAKRLQKRLAESANPLLNPSVDFDEYILAEHRIRVAGKNVFYVSAFDYYSTVNIAHLMDEGQRFWSMAAARLHDDDIRKHFAGAVMFHPFRNPIDSVKTFFNICTRALVRYALENGLIIYTVNHELFLSGLDDEEGSLQRTYIQNEGPGRGLLRSLSSLSAHDTRQTGLNVMFPLLIERATNDVITPPGVALMQEHVRKECVYAQQSGQWRERAYPTVMSVHVNMHESIERDRHSKDSANDFNDDGINPHLNPHERRRNDDRVGPKYGHGDAGHRDGERRSDNDDGDDEFVVLIAYRYQARYIHNIEEVIDSITRKLEERIDTHLSTYARVSIHVVSFGDLHACEQIDLISRANMFIFNHGAEGGLICFVQAGTLVVEMHPAGGTLPDFVNGFHSYHRGYTYASRSLYYFYSGTITSNPLCRTWAGHVMNAGNCGTIVLIHLFEEAMDLWLDVLLLDPDTE